MGHKQKIITIALWAVLFLVVLAVLAAKLLPSSVVAKLLPPGHASMPVLYEGPRFSLTDQDGKALSTADLRGKAYICDFIFTTCGSACPIMTSKLSNLQKETPAELNFVSFSVNPEFDTPAVLKTYARAKSADLTRWHFLTGTPAQMSQVAEQMKIQKPNEPHPAVNHSEKFFLVDGDGNVRGIYNSEDPDAMKALVADASWMATSRGARGK
jgi:protein SCO1/2